MPLAEDASDGRASYSQQQSIAGQVAQAQLGRPEPGESAGAESLDQLNASCSVDNRQCRTPSAVQCCAAEAGDREEEPGVASEPANSAGFEATEDVLPDTRLLEQAGRGEAEGNARSSANESNQVQ